MQSSRGWEGRWLPVLTCPLNPREKIGQHASQLTQLQGVLGGRGTVVLGGLCRVISVPIPARLAALCGSESQAQG